MVTEPQMKDSGTRRTFSTGAVRDRGGFKPRPDLISPHANIREGAWLAKGAEKYGVRNYEKGMPISECIASLTRHLEDYKLGKTDEDNMAAIRTNAGFVLHYEEEIKAGRMDPAIDDMPKYAERPVRTNRETGEYGMTTPFPSYVVPAVPVEDDATIPPNNILYESPPAAKSLERWIESIESPTFYVAGPMRGYKDLNFQAFDTARDRGKALGYNIISPADLDRANGIDPDRDPAIVEEENHLSTADLRRIVWRDVEAIMSLKPKRGDGIAVLPGWMDSTGARAEVALARWLGLRVICAVDFQTAVRMEVR